MDSIQLKIACVLRATSLMLPRISYSIKVQCQDWNFQLLLMHIDSALFYTDILFEKHLNFDFSPYSLKKIFSLVFESFLVYFKICLKIILCIFRRLCIIPLYLHSFDHVIMRHCLNNKRALSWSFSKKCRGKKTICHEWNGIVQCILQSQKMTNCFRSYLNSRNLGYDLNFYSDMNIEYITGGPLIGCPLIVLISVYK